MLNNFTIARLPRIEFGQGVFSRTAGICKQYGRTVLLVTGARSFKKTVYFKQLIDDLSTQDMAWHHCVIEGEPSPQVVDDVVLEYADKAIDLVLAVGGGSALDAGKAIAGLLRVQRTVMDYLEGVGPELAYQGPALPFIAVPTTAGTGSEATKNAVLSVQGANGFKKSFRDDRLVAEYAIVDPNLLISCPPDVIAANGMDALTQLIESYVSTGANAITDALALSGLRAVRDGLLPMYQHNDNAEARANMAYASLLSGICLAQTGLGSVHGLAAPLGAFYPIPHGVVCGTLVAEASALNIRAMNKREPGNPSLDKYARIAETLCRKRFKKASQAHEALLALLQEWTEQLRLPRLEQLGLSDDGIDHVVAHSRGSSMKTNPIVLTDAEIRQLLLSRM
ncbi:MAG: iron-containing alcohol dehydrogenase [Gammaproteobacteria bacterium]|nr:iron-containing alcohol dehydrogenase [Gammaproteobacteria bacterium]